jgi:HK97 family phage major capsid protein
LIEWLPVLSNEWQMPTVTETSTDVPVTTTTPPLTGRYGGFTPLYGNNETTIGPDQASKISQVTWTCKRMVVFTTLSRDIWSDSSRLRVWMDRMASGAIQYYLNNAIVMGMGVATGPQGIPNAPGTVTVPKTSGQASGTISTANIDAMWAGQYAGSRRNAVWLASSDTLEAIDQLSTAPAAGAWPEIPYCGTMQIGAEQVPTLKRRPVVVCEQCPKLGQTGDLILWDPSDWLLTYRSSQQAASVGAISVSVSTPPAPFWSGSYGLNNDAVERRMSAEASTPLNMQT